MIRVTGLVFDQPDDRGVVLFEGDSVQLTHDTLRGDDDQRIARYYAGRGWTTPEGVAYTDLVIEVDG